jgi:hypothetical protein
MPLMSATKSGTKLVGLSTAPNGSLCWAGGLLLQKGSSWFKWMLKSGLMVRLSFHQFLSP